ncbi:MAG: Sapep family Mn(2+)-dependent dipeptidase [Clostridiales bacterium]|nr:Sapep family Mn(2+)-dependent dipeptidase [Clostridiales bacterium]
MKQTIDQLIQESFPAQVEDLRALCRIPSVTQGMHPDLTAIPGKPLGEHIAAALAEFFALAHRLGFEKTVNLDGLCGYVDFGEGDELLAVLAHLDVVPAGEGWSYPPFGAEIHEGRLYARGVMDNKSAAVSALYALAAVRDAGIPLTRRVRVIVGCDEEAGWLCMKRYKETEELPALGFTPDSEYPVVHSEMGIMQAEYRKDYPSALRCSVGSAPNVVPGLARASLPQVTNFVALPEGLTLIMEGNALTVQGRGAHASTPELGHNALLGLLCALAAQDLPPEDVETIGDLHTLLDFDLHGEGLGLDITDESGRLTLSPDILRIDEGGLSLSLDCRYPFSVSRDALLTRWDEAFAACGLHFARVIKEEASHYIPADSELVSKLMEVYRKRTGRDSVPLSTGGGTYARAFTHAVAFGISPEGQESCAHMPDESMALEEILLNTQIMADAIVALASV